MKKFFILFLILLTFCGPSEDEIKAQVDLAVETALSDATSTTTTLAPTTSTTSTTSTTKPKSASASSQNSNCKTWANSTQINLGKYESMLVQYPVIAMTLLMELYLFILIKII